MRTSFLTKVAMACQGDASILGRPARCAGENIACGWRFMDRLPEGRALASLACCPMTTTGGAAMKVVPGASGRLYGPTVACCIVTLELSHGHAVLISSVAWQFLPLARLLTSCLIV